MVHKVKVKKIRVNVLPHTLMKQSVNVRVNVPDKVRRRRTKKPAGFSGRGGSGGGGVASLPTPIHAFTPVYIQSGQAPTAPESNPLLRYIQDTNHNITKKHEEHVANGLLKQTQATQTSQTTQTTQTQTTPNRREIPVYDGTPAYATPIAATPVEEKGTFATPKSFTKLHDFGDGMYMKRGIMWDEGKGKEPDTSSISGNEGPHEFQQVRHNIQRGRIAQPQQPDETNAQYQARLARNLKAKEKSGNAKQG